MVKWDCSRGQSDGNIPQFFSPASRDLIEEKRGKSSPNTELILVGAACSGNLVSGVPSARVLENFGYSRCRLLPFMLSTAME